MEALTHSITRRPVGEADDILLRTLFVHTRDDLALLPCALVDLQYAAQRPRFAINRPTFEHDILVVGDTDVGRVVLERHGDTTHLIDITIHRDHRRRGIASAVVRQILGSSRYVTLHVWSESGAAQSFFARLGFVRVSEGRGYVGMDWNART